MPYVYLNSFFEQPKNKSQFKSLIPLILKIFVLIVSLLLKYSQTSIIRSVRDRQIFFELSVVRIFEIGIFRKCSVVFVRY